MEICPERTNAEQHNNIKTTKMLTFIENETLGAGCL